MQVTLRSSRYQINSFTRAAAVSTETGSKWEKPLAILSGLFASLRSRPLFREIINLVTTLAALPLSWFKNKKRRHSHREPSFHNNIMMSVPNQASRPRFLQHKRNAFRQANPGKDKNRLDNKNRLKAGRIYHPKQRTVPVWITKSAQSGEGLPARTANRSC